MIGHDAITTDYALTTTKIIVVKISTCLKFSLTIIFVSENEIDHEWLQMTMNDHEWLQKNGIIANCDLNRHYVNRA